MYRFISNPGIWGAARAVTCFIDKNHRRCITSASSGLQSTWKVARFLSSAGVLLDTPVTIILSNGFITLMRKFQITVETVAFETSDLTGISCRVHLTVVALSILHPGSTNFQAWFRMTIFHSFELALGQTPRFLPGSEAHLGTWVRGRL